MDPPSESYRLFLRVFATLTISLVGVSKFATQAVAMIKENPELLSESLNFFPRLYHTYHLPFRPFWLARLARLPEPKRHVCGVF